MDETNYSALHVLIDFLDDIDQAWVAVLHRQIWDPELTEGVDLILPTPADSSSVHDHQVSFDSMLSFLHHNCTILLHTIPPAIPCRFGAACTHPGCYFSHPTHATHSAISCRFGAGCTHASCTFQHPEGRVLPIKGYQQWVQLLMCQHPRQGQWEGLVNIGV